MNATESPFPSPFPHFPADRQLQLRSLSSQVPPQFLRDASLLQTRQLPPLHLAVRTNEKSRGSEMERTNEGIALVGSDEVNFVVKG